MLKILIVSVLLVAFAIMGLAVKLLFDKEAEFTRHSSGEVKDMNDANSGASCGIKELVNCSKNEN